MDLMNMWTNNIYVLTDVFEDFDMILIGKVSFFQLSFYCQNFFINRWILLTFGQNNTHDLAEMLDDRSITLI